MARRKQLYEMLRDALCALEDQGVTPDMLAEELGCRTSTLRSYAYDYEDGNGSGRTFTRCLLIPGLLHRRGRPELLQAMNEREGLLTVARPTSKPTKAVAAKEGALAVAEAGRTLAAFFDATADGRVTDDEWQELDARIDQASARLAELREFARAMRDGRRPA